MRDEWKKLYIKQGGVWIILLFLLIEILSVGWKGYDSSLAIDQNQKIYQSYMQRFGGKLTEQKKQEIEEEKEQIQKAKEECDSWDQKYREKECFANVYQKHVKEGSKERQKEKIFTVFYGKYKYAAQNPAKRWILDSRAYETLLCHANADQVLIITIIVLVVLIFCQEEESGMQWLLLTTQYGKYQTIQKKMVLVVLQSAILSFVAQGIELIYLKQNVGFPALESKLQSIEAFQNTKYEITLWQAIGIRSGLLMIGAIFWGVLISVIALGLKKKVTSMVAAITFALSMQLLLKRGSLLYRIPSPFGFLKSSAYMWGDQYLYTYETKNMQQNLKGICEFKAVSVEWLVIEVFLSVLLMAGTIWFAICIYRKEVKLRLRIFQKRKIEMFVIILGMAMIETGCSKAQREKITYNSQEEVESFSYKNGTVEYTGDTDDMRYHIQYTDFTGKKEDLLREEIRQDWELVGIYVIGSECYYMTELCDDCEIYELDLETGNTQLIYTTESENQSNFWGLYEKEDRKPQMTSYSNLFSDGKDIFFVQNNTLKKVTANGLSAQTVISDLGVDIIFEYMDGTITYLDAEGKEQKVSIDK